MSENIHPLFPDRAAADAGASHAPALPTEPHIVATALAAERLRSLSEQMLLFLRYAPRDADTFDRVNGEILSAWSDLSDHYTNYRHVLECRGQA